LNGIQNQTYGVTGIKVWRY